MAKERWELLKAAIFDKTKGHVTATSASVRRFSTFILFGVQAIPSLDAKADEWLLYKYTPLPVAVKVRLVPQEFTLEDITGFNNTGNVCIWPSEEIMAFYCLENISLFKGKNVCELGAGMTGLAGLMLAASHSPSQVVLTDGNQKSIDNLTTIIQANSLQEGDLATTSLLRWDVTKIETEYSHFVERFEVIICADCFFFTDVQSDLVVLIHHLLKPKGRAYLFAPERSGTFTQFIEKTRKYFHVEILRHYHQLVDKRHLYYTQTDPAYDPNLHYPYCVVLERS